MPNFHFQNVLNILPTTYNLYFQAHHTGYQERLVIPTGHQQKIIVTKEPDAQGLETFINHTVYDEKIPIACMVAVTTNDEKSRYFKQTTPFVVGQYIISSKHEKAYFDMVDIYTLMARFTAEEYAVTIRDSDQQTKTLSLFHLSLPKNDVVINHEEMVSRVFEIFKFLQNRNNIAIYSSTTNGRVVHIVLALCLLMEFESIFCGDTPKTIAHNILVIINKICHHSGLAVSEASVIAAVELTDLIYQQNRNHFHLIPIGKFSNARSMSNLGLHGHVVTPRTVLDRKCDVDIDGSTPLLDQPDRKKNSRIKLCPLL